jgi:CheY-like chemotaxis protein
MLAFTVQSREVADRNRILVVDDNVDVAETTAELLSAMGYQVSVAHEGVEALALAARFRPQVCLLDIGLPVMDGYELARRLRELPELRPLRLVALTGYGDSGERALAQTFDAHLVKPVDLDALVASLS